MTFLPIKAAASFSSFSRPSASNKVLVIQVLRAHIDPQVGAALSAVHDNVSTPWTVESPAAAAGMSRSAFAGRFKELLEQTPLEYVTEWRMLKAMQLLEQRDKKLIVVARSVGYGPTLRSVRRSSELSGPVPVNSSNVVLETRGMPEAKDSDIGAIPVGAKPSLSISAQRYLHEGIGTAIGMGGRLSGFMWQKPTDSYR